MLVLKPPSQRVLFMNPARVQTFLHIHALFFQQNLNLFH